MWIVFAFASAIFAGIGAVVSKVDSDGIDSDVAAAIRFTVIFGLSWVAPILTGAITKISQIDGRTLLFVILSGIAMGATWLFYFKALSVGEVNRVVPVDKSAIALSMLFAFIFLRENVTVLRIISMCVIAFGTFLMFPTKSEKNEKGHAWLILALLAALFAAIASTVSKLGADGVDPDLGTAIRASVMLPMAWSIPVFSGKLGKLKGIRKKALWATVISGVATCLSWIVYYRALADGPASVVTPIEKLNLLVCVVLSYFLFGEKLTKRYALGVGLIAVGTFALVI